jgi:GNAT superfamily N-acetyltransferase
MPIEITPVRGAKERELFIRLPREFYRHDTNWTPPLLSAERKLLDRDRNPFWKHAEGEDFLARRDGKPVGRISAIVNGMHNRVHEDRTGFFGFYECEPNDETARALLAAAEEWLRAKGMDTARGPANPSMNDTAGMLVDGFQWPPFVLMTYNPRYYPGQLESAGYEKAMDLYAYMLLQTEVNRKKIDRVAGRIRKRNEIRIRTLDLGRFHEELQLVMEIYNDAWEKNWGFVPMTDEEIAFTANDMKSILLPEFTYFAEYEGETVGFSLALPDINTALRKCDGNLFPFGWIRFLRFNLRKIPTVRVVALGVKKKHQHLGIGPLFYQRYFDEGMKRGYRAAEMSWILENNPEMNRPLRLMGGDPYKTYRMYEKRLDQRAP